MKKYLFMAVAAIAALSSCSSDNEVFDSEAKKALTFTATMESIGGDTRATFDNKSAKWEAGDEISIMGIDESFNVTKASYVTSGTNGTSTTFELATPGQGVSGIMFQGFFPSYILDGVACVIPAVIEETWAEGQFNMPMYAESATTTLAFKNICGVLAIKVNKDQLTKVQSIRISSSNRNLCGKIRPETDSEGNISGVALLSTEKDDNDDLNDNLQVNYTTAVEIGEEGNVFYVPIPPSYKRESKVYVADPYKDLKIEISDGSGTSKSMTTKKDADILVERNKIYNITFKDNTPTIGKAKAKINGVDVDVKWVQLWAGGPKFAEYNVGVTNGKTESYGGYYCWGSSIDSDPDEACYDGNGEFSGEYDTATNLWGSNWRMPTNAEYQALVDNCTWTCTEQNGVSGWLCTGNGDYSSNSIFLPIAGYANDGHVMGSGSVSYYFSSTPYDEEKACDLFLVQGFKNVGYDYRDSGCSVRAVLNEQ